MSKVKTFPKRLTMPVMCPACSRMFDYTVYPEITIPGDSKLKKMVLNKTMFFPCCPYCGEEFKIKGRCIYRNEKKKEIFIVTESKGEEYETMLKSGDIHLNDISTDDDVVDFLKGCYTRRVVYDVDAFREKILLSDYNYDDRIIELMKLSLSGLIERDSRMPVYRIFLEETAGNQLEFTAIVGRRPPFEYMSIKTAAGVYTQFKNKYLQKIGNPEDDEYIATDQKWAARSHLLQEEDMGIIIPVN